MKKNDLQLERWYTNYPQIKLLMQLTETLPRSLQEGVGENLIKLIKPFENAQGEDLNPTVINAGLNLHKSQRMQRWYDRIPQLHKALNRMILLPEKFMVQLDVKCSRLAAYLGTINVGAISNPYVRTIEINGYLSEIQKIVTHEVASLSHLHAE